MKTIIATLVLLFTVSLGFSQEKKAQQISAKSQVVEASCGQCQFGMKDKKGCDLAVKIDNKTYFVERAKMNDYGDAHGHDGMCSTTRKAEVTGEVKDGKYVASSFKLLPVEGHNHEGEKH